MKSKYLLASVCGLCRSPCGERGLKYRNYESAMRDAGRSPCGERGLKSMPLTRAGIMIVAPRAGSVG